MRTVAANGHAPTTAREALPFYLERIPLPSHSPHGARFPT